MAWTHDKELTRIAATLYPQAEVGITYGEYMLSAPGWRGRPGSTYWGRKHKALGTDRTTAMQTLLQLMDSHMLD